jgi:hypothetical protein
MTLKMMKRWICKIQIISSSKIMIPIKTVPVNIKTPLITEKPPKDDKHNKKRP